MDKPLVSIIIRTCGKPEVLKNALDSVRSQTYANIETIVIEDGPPISENCVVSNFSGLNCRYYATGRNLGRSRAGNLGLAMARGNYINFLDEDDLLLEHHVELLAGYLKKSSRSAVYAVAEERQIKVKSFSPYVFHVKRRLIRYRHPFNRLLLCYMNLFPVQSVMFDRRLFDQYGGFDESLDYLEDWDLWLRYAMKEDFGFINDVTSVYFTPYKKCEKRRRNKALRLAEQQIQEKAREYTITLNPAQINQDMDYILNVFNKKGIVFYLQKIRNFLLYGDSH